MPKATFGYWNIRGFGQQIRLLLEYLKVDYEEKTYPFGPAPDFSRDSWLDEKFKLGLPFPNLPYYIDENGVKITESKAILKYIARTKGAALVPSCPKLLARVDMVEGVANDLQRALVNLSYAHTKINEPLEVLLSPKLEYLSDFLSQGQGQESGLWSTGESISYVDFFLYEVLHQFEAFKADFLQPYPPLRKFVENFEALPGLADIREKTKHYICYSPWAPLQF